jgi:hypothetical protein
MEFNEQHKKELLLLPLYAIRFSGCIGMKMDERKGKREEDESTAKQQ